MSVFKNKLRNETIVIDLDNQDLVFSSVEEQNDYFEHLFDDAPIPFKPRRNNQLDKAIAVIIEEWIVTIPIVHIKNNLFLIGCNRVNCDYKFNSVLVKVGGGSQKLIDYLHKNSDQILATLIENMIKSGK